MCGMALKQNDFNVAAETFLRDLSEFVTRNKAIRCLMDSDVEEGSETGADFSSCPFCANHPFIENVCGYWIECVEKDCPKAKLNASKEYSTETRCHCIFSTFAPEEIYRNYFYGSRHCSYFTREDDIGPVFLTIKQEFLHSKDFIRVMVRSVYHIIHGILPVTSICSSQYNQDKVVQFLTDQIGLLSTLRPVTLPSVPSALLKMDKAFNKLTYKVGVLYMKEGQQTEDELLSNPSHSTAFEDFLDLLGERVQLLGFTKFRAGLDSSNDLTGTHSVYTQFGKNEIMFHVSTLLPFEERDLQKVQRKRHIGNDIVCIVFMEAAHTKFFPDCIKSNFLHTFIIVQVDPSEQLNKYMVACVSRNQVPSYGPPLHENQVFQKGPLFRDWILRKVISGEQACHSAPKFAKLHSRTQCQIMEDIIKATELKSSSESSLTNRDHGRWLHQTPNSSFNDLQDKEDTVDIVTRDFTAALGSHASTSGADTAIFIVGKEHKKRFVGVRSTMASNSRVFHKMFTEESHSSVDSLASQSNGPQSPQRSRPASWTRTSSHFQSKARSGKFRLEKLKLHKSENDGDGGVILASVTDLSHSGTGPGPTHPECVLEEFESDVFEALMEYLHSGCCDMTSNVLPGLLRAAQHFDIPDLCETCLEKSGELIAQQTVSSSSCLVPNEPSSASVKGDKTAAKDTSL